MSTLLAIECSAKSAGTAVVKDGHVLCELFTNNSLTHSQTLLPMIDETLKTAKTALCDIDEIAISTGPGSFTGLRIGIATVKGLCEKKDFLCKGISTLLALAHNDYDDCIVCACMDARRDRVYNALFETKGGKVTRLCADRAIEISALLSELETISQKVILTGDAGKKVYDGTNQKNIFLAHEKSLYPCAGSVAFAADKAYNEVYTGSSNGLVPKYLKQWEQQK